MQVYDLRNKLIAISVDVEGGVRHLLCEWGVVVIVGHDGRVLCLKERPLATKLEMLFAKNLYVVALNLAQSELVWIP